MLNKALYGHILIKFGGNRIYILNNQYKHFIFINLDVTFEEFQLSTYCNNLNIAKIKLLTIQFCHKNYLQVKFI